MKTYKKVLFLGLALLIVAGIVVVLFKGFNVDLMLKAHSELIYNLPSEYSLKDVNTICKDVFKDKEFRVLEFELFGDCLQICSESITDEEKITLINRLNDVYYKDNIDAAPTSDNVTVNSIPNVRLIDWIKPYVLPIIVVYAIIAVYVLIRYKKLGGFKTLGELVAAIVAVIAILLSVIAITRLPLKPYYITVILACSMIMTSGELLIFEKRLSDISGKKK